MILLVMMASKHGPWELMFCPLIDWYRDPMRFLAPCSPREKGRNPGKVLDLYLPVYPDILERGVLGFWSRYNIDEFETVVAKWVRRDNINLFDDSPIICAIRSLTYNKFPSHVDRYVKVIQKLIGLGADLHRISEMSELSLLQELLAEGNDPYAASVIFKFWTTLLNEAQVDMAHYFNIELDLYQKRRLIFLTAIEGRRRYITLVMDAEGRPHFSWDWWIDPQAAASEAVTEFRNFGPPWHDLTLDTESSSPKWKYNFPFVYLSIHTSDQPPEDSSATQGWDKLQSQIWLWGIRGERRRQKKASKFDRAKAKWLDRQRLQLPGAWID